MIKKNENEGTFQGQWNPVSMRMPECRSPGTLEA